MVKQKTIQKADKPKSVPKKKVVENLADNDIFTLTTGK